MAACKASSLYVSTLTAGSSPHAAGRRAQKRSRNADGSARTGGEGSPQQHGSNLGNCTGRLALPAVDAVWVSGDGSLQQQRPALRAGSDTAQIMASLLGDDWLADLGSPVQPKQHCTEALCDPPPAQSQPQRASEQRAQPQKRLSDVSSLFPWPDSDEDGPQAAELHLGSESYGQRQWQQHSGDLKDDSLADLPTITWDGSAGEASHRGGCLLRSTLLDTCEVDEEVAYGFTDRRLKRYIAAAGASGSAHGANPAGATRSVSPLPLWGGPAAACASPAPTASTRSTSRARKPCRR